jgi:O-antigen/teichoic acid export membrane protein
VDGFLERAFGPSVSEAEAPLPSPQNLSVQAAEDVSTVARGGAIQIVGQIVQRSLTFLFSVVATQPGFLNVAGFGLYRFLSQVFAVAGQVGLMGFNYASMRFISMSRARGDPGGVRSAARIGLVGTGIASAIVVLGVVVGAGLLASWFGEDAAERRQLVYLVRVGAAYVPLFAFLQVLRYCTQAYKTMVPSVIAGNIVQPAARFVLGVAALLAGFSVTGAVTTLWLSMAAGALVGALYLRRMLTEEERRARPQPLVRPMLKFAFPQAGASLFQVQALGVGVILLKYFESNFEVGLFAIGLALQGPGAVFLSGIVNIWAPVVSDLHARGEIQRLESLYKTITRWVATFSFPVFAALIVFPDLFVRFFGPAASQAAPLVAVLAAGNLFYTGTGPSGYVISMTGRPGVNFANSVVGVALYVLLGVLLIPRYGALGMAIGDALVTTVMNSARVFQAKVLVGVQPFGRSFLKPVAATGVAALFSVTWRGLFGEGLPVLVAGLAAAAVVYLVVLRAFGLDPEERHVWERIRSRASKRPG